MVLGPIIPGRPTPAKPAAPTPKKRVDTTTLKGVLAASRPKPPSTQTKFIPELGTDAQRAQLSPAVLGQAPKLQRSTLGTGSIETKTAPTADGTSYGGKGTAGGGAGGAGGESAASKPIQVTLDQEEMDAAQAAADALREFQKNQANMQLQQALGKIDRAAIEQYKGISEDYAARGLARSGGKLQKEQQAIDERDRAVGEAKQAVTDFLNELRLTGNLEQASTNLGKSQAFQDYITGRLAPAMGE